MKRRSRSHVPKEQAPQSPRCCTAWLWGWGRWGHRSRTQERNPTASPQHGRKQEGGLIETRQCRGPGMVSSIFSG
ncbi:hypothetical protein B0H12DRAFT_1157093, partial [Mycena haematopus]